MSDSIMKSYINILKYLILITFIWVISIPALVTGHEATISQIDYKSFYPQISLYISVIDDSGQPLQTIEQDKFIVTENKKKTSITKFNVGIKGEIITLLVIDRSGSMEKINKIGSAKEAAIKFINQMREGDKTGLIIFNHDVKELQDFTSDKEVLINNINSISPDGSTSFYDAVYDAINRLKSVQGRKGVISLTDGLDNGSSHSSDDVIQYAKDENIPLYTIGLGAREADKTLDEGLNEDTLNRMAEQTGGRYFYTPSGEELSALYQLIARQIQNEYVLTYNSPTPLYNLDKRNVIVKIINNGELFQATGAYNPTGFLYTPPVPQISGSINWTFFTILTAVLLFLLFLPKIIMRAKPLFSALIRRPKEMPSSTHLSPATTEEVKITLLSEEEKPQEVKKEEEDVNIVLIDKEIQSLSPEGINIILLDEKEKTDKQ